MSRTLCLGSRECERRSAISRISLTRSCRSPTMRCGRTRSEIRLVGSVSRRRPRKASGSMGEPPPAKWGGRAARADAERSLLCLEFWRWASRISADIVSPRDLVSPPDMLSPTDRGLSCPEAVCRRNAERPLFMSLSPHRRAPIAQKAAPIPGASACQRMVADQGARRKVGGMVTGLFLRAVVRRAGLLHAVRRAPKQAQWRQSNPICILFIA